MLSRFDTVPECDGQTDGQTDEQNCYIKIARQHLLCHRGASLTLYGHIKTAEQRTIIQQYGDRYIGRLLVGCYIWCSEEGPGGCGPAQFPPRCTKCHSSLIDC